MSSFSIQTTTRTRGRGLTVDLNNFSYGGNTPLYSTFESELNFETIHHIRASSSEDDIIGYQDDSEDSDQELQNKHHPTITPFNNKNESTNTGISHNTTSKSMVLTRQHSNSMSLSTTNTPIPHQSRKRAQTNKFHITSSSFHHFRIRSITINPSNPLNNHIDDTTYMDDHKHNKTLSTATMNPLKEEEEHDIDQPRHRATGTVIIDGHPPLPTLSNDISGSTTASVTTTATETAHISNNSVTVSKTKYVIIPKKKRKTVGFASSVVDPKRKYIEKEILETEETYYRGLYTLLNELIIPMFENNLIPEKYRKQCTSNLPALLEFHDGFLTQLVEVYEHQKNKNKTSKFNSISQVFNAVNKEEFIDLYLTYIRDYDSILDLFGNTFHNNDKLQIFLKEKRRERKPLTNFLILPVQRVPRYILLLTDLKKHTLPSDIDYKNIEAALELAQEIANEINERKRQIENMSQCLQIQEALSDLHESIVKQGREYQKQFVFIKKGNNHQRQFFVFTDIIIVTNHNWRVKDILDIRIVDIKLKAKIATLKKKKSFRLRMSKNKDNKENDDSKMMENGNDNNKFTEFILLYSNSKPCTYVAKDINEFMQFESVVKENRLILLDTDLAKEKDTLEIRHALKINGVSQADDYQREINSMKSKRKRGNASADKFVLKQSKSAPIYQ